MSVLKSVEELKAIRENTRRKIMLRYPKTGAACQAKDSGDCKYQVMVCAGTGCMSSNSEKIAQRLDKELEARGMIEQVQIVRTGCFGLCALGPIMIVYPQGSFYSMITVDDVAEIVEEHFVNGRVVKRLLYKETVDGDNIKSLSQTSFYKKQLRVALKNCGMINPENIDEYIAMGGYVALEKAILAMKSADIIDMVKESGLRGRGGGGFPTGAKWGLAANNHADQKYVCCNADEGDPGAFMDRSILEGDPHVVIEAMTIAGKAIGATKGFVYVRAEYPIAVKRLEIAISQARQYGLLGENIFGSTFSFDIDIRPGAGAFVCGEETALMTSIEGHRGEPRPRPPYPAVKGLFGKPTILNNVETYANIPQIIMNGPESFKTIGTEKSKGTKVFALGGKINNTGLVEVPMGTTLRTIVEEIGGGVSGDRQFKAAQTGGPSGGCIPAQYMDIPIDYDNLIEIGSMMGSGGLIVMDDTTCMVDIAKFFLEFTVDESCGKCTPCRIGNKRLLEILTKITEGRGKPEDLQKLDSLCGYIKQNSLCGLGQTAPNPIISTMRYFRHEYEEHINQKKCRAGVCKSMIKYSIIADKCKGCTACARVCQVGAIFGKVKDVHIIDDDKCVKCGACIERCKFGAIIRS